MAASDLGPLPEECPHSAYMRPEWCTTCIDAARKAATEPDGKRLLQRPNGKP